MMIEILMSRRELFGPNLEPGGPPTLEELRLKEIFQAYARETAGDGRAFGKYRRIHLDFAGPTTFHSRARK